MNEPQTCKIRVTLATLSAIGNISVFMLLFIRRHNGLANSLYASLIICAGILSGPAAFDVFNDLSNFSTNDQLVGWKINIEFTFI